MILSPQQRIAGILVPVSALRGRDDLGIGDAGSLVEFIDWAAKCGFRLVKMLPINETGDANSPYDAISSVAIEPAMIKTTPAAIPDLREAEYQRVRDEATSARADPKTVNYAAVKTLKRRLLEVAFDRFDRWQFHRKSRRALEFVAFTEAQASWLNDYALFRVLVEVNGTARWRDWPKTHQTPAEARTWLAALPETRAKKMSRRIRFVSYVQWIAFNQWQRVKKHAESRGIALMGDIPFGVSFHSADVWAQPHLFKSGWFGGTPPDKIFKHDAFVQKWGQNWGIPIYDWDAMRQTEFAWWRRRVRGVREFFDLFRIDHILGFYRIYGFPWPPEENSAFLNLTEQQAKARTGGRLPRFHPRPDDTAENRELNRKDGEEYLRIILETAGAGRVIGEDLGEVPEYVRPNLASLGIAGYKIPVWEKRDAQTLTPGSEYERLSLATYGTHDHEPLKAFWERLTKEADNGEEDARDEQIRLRNFTGYKNGALPDRLSPKFHEALLEGLFHSNSWIAVVMFTDLFGREERFNYPGVLSSKNWTQRIHADVAELYHDPRLPRWQELIRASGRF